MSELDDILAALEASDAVKSAVATVVGVQGSTYRRPGARLVIPAEGHPVGSISGGCLEPEVIRSARETLSSGKPKVVRFDLTSDDPIWGWGAGCNGVIDVLVESTASAHLVAAALRSARQDRKTVVLVTVIAGERLGRRILLHGDGRTEGSFGADALDRTALEAAVTARQSGQGTTVLLEPHGVPAFVEVISPPLRLVVCGAGPGAIPLVEMGSRLGWRVEVVDDRAPLLTADRFPQAHRVVRARPRDAAAAVEADDHSCVVVMSHSFWRDTDYLRSFLARTPAYVGVLGPRARLAQLFEALQAGGIQLPPEALHRVHGPAGLDLGAEGPDEIALAIAAEILAVQRRASAGFLRGRPGPVHALVPAGRQ